ncbi:MAG: N-acetylmuramic acid 6-phosphate etherase [Ruminococcaceae bacterium]|nr:N-acetylmuramic acid 6-phosphate etherase [Oscillospiraceae bacterium]
MSSPTEARNAKTTHIDQASTAEMLRMISEENMNSVRAVDAALDQIAPVVDAAAASLARGGRIVYIGCGTSGRIAVADAAECPPTYGVDYNTVIAIIAGGEKTLVRAAEGEEDSAEKGREDLLARNVTADDIVIGISASGNAAYVASALKTAREIGCVTASLSSNPDCLIGRIADYPITADTGAEVITGSTRMKAGNAQKMILNMISTCAMVKTGKVYENLMINLRPTNIKLRARMISIVSDICGTDAAASEALLEANNFVIRDAVAAFGK